MPETFSGTAYSYIRFSSREQEQGDSIRRQRALRDEWLARQPGVTLDTAFGGEDRGVSAFRGRHRTDKHHLGRFLEAVRDRKVRAGSLLLLESLDRLSREEEEDALALLLSLLNAGVVIVQLEPYTVFRKGDGMMGLMRALIYFSRAREESATKSARMRTIWQRKRTEAANKKAIVSNVRPAWLEIVDRKFRFKPGARETLRRIFRLAIDGHGASLIVQALNGENVPHFEGPGHSWSRTYLSVILRSTAVIGRYEPKQRVNGKRGKIDGATVEGYYPAAVSLADWHAAQKAVTARTRRGGRRGTGGWVALYGPVYDARTGGKMQATRRVDKDSGRRYRVLQPEGVQRWGGKCVSFPLASFENAVRAKLRELDLRDVFPAGDEPARVTELKEQLAEVELRRSRLQAALVDGSEDTDALPVLRELGERCRRLGADLADAQAEQASPARASLAALSDLEQSAAVETDPAVRLRYRACAARVIERLDVLVVASKPSARRRLAAVQIRFAGSAAVRSYLVAHRSAMAGEPEAWAVLTRTVLEDCDLRKPADVKQLEPVLAKLDLARLV